MMGSQLNKFILQALGTHDMYGLEIIKFIEDITNGETIIKQPSLYSALRRLEEKGSITSYWQDSDIGGRRHYYTLAKDSQSSNFTPSPIVDKIDIPDDVKTDIINPMTSFAIKDDAKEPKIEDEIAQPLEKPTFYQEFDPNKNFIATQKSFSQVSKEYVEPKNEFPEFKLNSSDTKIPSEISESQPFSDEIMSQSNGLDYSMPEEYDFSSKNTDSFNVKNNNEINYKDILGELDAEPTFNNERNINTFSSVDKQQSVDTTSKIEKSTYSKQVADILLNNKKTKNTNNNKTSAVPKSTQATLDEINRRYNLNHKESKLHTATNTPTPSPAVGNSVSYNYIKQDKINVKPYIKMSDEKVSTKAYLNINRLNFCRALIMFILLLAQLTVSYFVLQNNNLIYQPHIILYLITLIGIGAYLFISILFLSKDLDKKCKLNEINFGLNLFYRFILTVVLMTFIIAVSLCFGMTFFNELQFLAIWFLPGLCTMNILISWLVGFILYKAKLFRI